MKNSTNRLIIDLYKEGILLWVKNGQLNYKVSSRKLNEEEMILLKENKDLIIQELSQGGEGYLYKNRNDPYTPFPLTDIQSAYLLGRGNSFEYGNVSSHVYFEIIFPKLDRVRAEKVWNKLIRRHHSLRNIITPDSKQKTLENVPDYKLIWNEKQCFSTDDESIKEIRNNLINKYYEVEKWPLFDIGVSHVNKKSIMHLSFDFLILDWVSIWILIKEYEQLYFEDKDELIKLEYSFKEYCFDEKEIKKSSKYIIDKDYWMKKVDDFSKPPLLPIKPNMVENEFERHSLVLDSKEWIKIKQYSAKVNITPTVTLLTAFSLCLEYWSENPNFTLNLTMLKRDSFHKQIDQVIGDFTSISLLNVKIKRKKSFLENAKDIQVELMENLEHNLFSGVEVLRELRRVNNTESFILPIVFTSSVGVINPIYDYVELNNYGVSQTPQVFLDCQVMDNNNNLQINWDVRKGIFPSGIISTLLNQFYEYLISLTKDKWENLYSKGLPEKELKIRRDIDNNNKDYYLRPLHIKVLEQIEHNSQSVAIVEGEIEFTYKDLGQKAAAIANELHLRGGESGDKVAILMKHGITEVAAVIGVLSLGMIYIPIDVDQPEERINSILKQSSAKYLLVDMENTNNYCLETIVCESLVIEEWKTNIKDNNLDELAYIIFTSGTTGVPKGVEITHKSAANTIESILDTFKMPHPPNILAISKLNFDLSVFDIFGVLSLGGKVVYPKNEDRINPYNWVDLIKKENINIWNTVPALMQLLINYLESERLNINLGLELILLSGDWIPIKLPDSIRKYTLDPLIVSLGGATEAAIWSVYHICRVEDKYINSIPYGKPLPNQKVMILDEHLEHRPIGVQGEIYISGLGLARGYTNNESETERSFIKTQSGERIYKTGDFGRYLSNGEIEFLGRKDDQIKINGYRIELDEIKLGLLKNPKIELSDVIFNCEKDIVAFIKPTLSNNYRNSKEDIKCILKNIEEFSYKYQDTLLVEEKQLKEILDLRDSLSTEILLDTLQNLGFFKDERVYNIIDILSINTIDEKYKWIIKYWIYYLKSKNYLIEIEEEKYKRNICVNKNFSSFDNWDMLISMWDKYIGDSEFIKYIMRSKDNIFKQLNGTKNPIDILYQEGSLKTVEAIYEYNIFAKYFNKSIVNLILSIIKNKKEKRIRILEVGAGTGMTSKMVLEMLSKIDCEYEYCFTDIAQSFLTNAKVKLSKYKNISYKIFDINEETSKQGFINNEFDIILAVGVLENAKNIEETMRNLVKLLDKSSWFIFTEPIVEESWILASQVFLMQEPKDDIRKKVTYTSEEKWKELLEDCGQGEEVLILPNSKDKLFKSNMRLFAKKFNTSLEILNEDEVLSNLKKYVPSYMEPKYIKILQQFPLSLNGKVDKAKLKQWSKLLLNRNKVKVIEDNSETQSINSLEKELCKIWSKVLGRESLNINKNLYEYGADSLIMAQASGKIRDFLSVYLSETNITFDMILRQQLNYPYIHNLAKFIISKNEKLIDLTLEESKIQLHNTNKVGKITNFGGGEGVLRIVFHAGFGTMNSMNYVIKDLVEQRKGPVLGITINDNDNYCSIPSEDLVSSISKEYAELIMEHNPEKVQLIGYCLGGLIAVETAYYLVDNGVDIVDLTLIDSYPSPFSIKDSIASEAIFLPNYFTSYGELYPEVSDYEVMDIIIKAFEKFNNNITESCLYDYVMEEATVSKELRELILYLYNISLEERFSEYSERIKNIKGEDISKELMLSTFKTNIASWRGANMTPLPYIGDVRFLLAEEKMDFLFADVEETIEFWQSVCLGDFNVISIPGNHVTCTELEENAHKISSQLENPLL